MKILTAFLVGALTVLGAPFAHAQITPEQIVREERSKFPTPLLKGQHEAMLRAIITRLNTSVPDGPYGLLVKKTGNNCGGYSCDIICSGQGASQRQYDVLADEGHAAAPHWSGPLETIVVRECEYVTGAPPMPPGPTCPGCPPDLSRELEDAKREVDRGRLALDQARAQQLEAERERDTIRQELEQLRAQPAPACQVTGPGWVRSMFKIGCRVVVE